MSLHFKKKEKKKKKEKQQAYLSMSTFDKIKFGSVQNMKQYIFSKWEQKVEHVQLICITKAFDWKSKFRVRQNEWSSNFTWDEMLLQSKSRVILSSAVQTEHSDAELHISILHIIDKCGRAMTVPVLSQKQP